MLLNSACTALWPSVSYSTLLRGVWGCGQVAGRRHRQDIWLCLTRDSPYLVSSCSTVACGKESKVTITQRLARYPCAGWGWCVLALASFVLLFFFPLPSFTLYFTLTSCFCLFGISAITVAKEWPTGWGLNCTLWSTHLSKIIVFRRIKLSTILCMELWYCLTCIHFKLFHKDLALASPVNWCSGVRFFLFVI